MEAAEHRSRVMASELQVITVSAATADPSWATDVVGLLDHLEARWSRFLSDSDISRINTALGHPVQVDPVTLTLLDAMLEAWEVTERRFDPTLLRPLLTAGYRSSVEDERKVTILPSGGVAFVNEWERAPQLSDIEIDHSRSIVRLPPGIVLDAGGIGKGLAADLAVDHLLTAGAHGALVGIGGDISADGNGPDGAWTVDIAHPDPDRGIVCTFTVDRGGVATSSTRSRRWWHDGSERHHVIDPWTGAPSTTDLWSATVVAGSGRLAEAHATAVLLAGSDHAVDYLERHGLSGLAVAADGRVVATDDLDVTHAETAAVAAGGWL